MRSGFVGAGARLVSGLAILGLSSGLLAQDPGSATPASAEVPSSAIPDAPTPQFDLAWADPQSAPSQNSQQPPPESAPAPTSSSSDPQSGGSPSSSSSQQGSSSAQTPTPPTPQKSQREKAAEQIKEQEKQRVVGILPSFNVTYLSDAASMTASQKIGLAFRSAIDP